MGIFSHLKGGSQGGTVIRGVLFEVWGQRGWPQVEVVGESHHTREIRALFPARLDSAGQEVATPVTVTHDAKNRHDKNAVEVRASVGLLGYLSREDAARYAPVLSALQAQGVTPATMARVWAYEGYSYDDSNNQQFTGSVRVDLPEPHMLVPANLPPQGAHVILPVGAAIQVAGEEKHMRAIAPFLNSHGECWAHATLHEIVDQSGRTAKTLTEVRINSEPVGRLTPKMSTDMLPVVNYLSGRGKLAGVRAIVKGNALKAEVVLYTMRSSQLPADWFEHSAASGVAIATAGSGQGASSTGMAIQPVGESSGLTHAASGAQEQVARPPLPPANWYPDPQGVARLRYWDGARWTGRTAP